MGVEAPTPEQVASAEATRTDGLSSYLDDEQLLAAELRRAEGEGRKPNLKPFNEVTIKTVAPHLLKGYKEPEPEAPFNTEEALANAGGGNEYVEGEQYPVQDSEFLSTLAEPVNEEEVAPEESDTEPEPGTLIIHEPDENSEDVTVEVPAEEIADAPPVTKAKKPAAKKSAAKDA